MRGNVIRWIVSVVMVAALAVLVASPAMATDFAHQIEVPLAPATLEAGSVTPLPWDVTVPGNPASKDNWLSAEEYLDDTIHMVQLHDVVSFSDKKGKQKLNCYVVLVTIADPSQLRSAFSYDDYSSSKRAKAADMAKAKNAIAAVNGDFCKYYDDRCYVIRGGTLYNNVTTGQRDVLIIDSQGDFSALRMPDTETVEAAIAALPDGVTAMHTVTLGPVLVENGEVQDMGDSAPKKAKHSSDQFQYPYRMQRVAIVQLGRLQYAIVECNGKADASSGMSLQVFAEYIHDLFPDAMLAYNLDGGGSTNVIVNGKRIHKNPDAREIGDILYFATAAE